MILTLTLTLTLTLNLTLTLILAKMENVIVSLPIFKVSRHPFPRWVRGRE